MYIEPSEPLQTKEDYEILLQELEAYADLDNQPFNFGIGNIINDGEFHLGVEYAYLKMDILQIEDILNYWNWVEDYEEQFKELNKVHKWKLNGYTRKMYHKKYKHINKLKNPMYRQHYGYNMKTEEYLYYDRIYYSSRKGYAKYCSNRKIRNADNDSFKFKGNNCNKLFDYWWKVF